MVLPELNYKINIKEQCRDVCVCVCVLDRERERARVVKTEAPT
jgi:hypothetical protein